MFGSSDNEGTVVYGSRPEGTLPKLGLSLRPTQSKVINGGRDATASFSLSSGFECPRDLNCFRLSWGRTIFPTFCLHLFCSVLVPGKWQGKKRKMELWLRN